MGMETLYRFSDTVVSEDRVILVLFDENQPYSNDRFSDAVRLIHLWIFGVSVLMTLQCRKAQHLLSRRDS